MFGAKSWTIHSFLILPLMILWLLTKKKKKSHWRAKYLINFSDYLSALCSTSIYLIEFFVFGIDTRRRLHSTREMETDGVIQKVWSSTNHWSFTSPVIPVSSFPSSVSWALTELSFDSSITLPLRLCPHLCFLTRLWTSQFLPLDRIKNKSCTAR